MSICDRDTVKLLAGITDNVSYNNLIDFQIPVVEELIHDYCNTDFISSKLERVKTNKGYEDFDVPNVNVYGDFVISGNTITSTSSEFSDFVSGDSIMISNSIRNDGYYTIESVTDTVITTVETLESEDDYINIVLMSYPKSVKMIAARMVGWDVLNRNKASGIKSESIESYSVTYKDINGSSYPADIVAGLKKFHRGV